MVSRQADKLTSWLHAVSGRLACVMAQASWHACCFVCLAWGNKAVWYLRWNSIVCIDIQYSTVQYSTRQVAKGTSMEDKMQEGARPRGRV